MRTIEELNEKLFCKCNCDTCEKYIECEEDFDGFCDDILLYTKHIAGIKLDRLVEICNAERDGRCVVLPCRVGDSCYSESVINGRVREFAAPDEVWIFRTRNLFGKEIFLTREAAEAALKECGQNG